MKKIVTIDGQKYLMDLDDAIQRGTVEKFVSPKIGQVFLIGPNILALLSRVSMQEAALIILADAPKSGLPNWSEIGNRWSRPVPISSNILRSEEWTNLIGNNIVTYVGEGKDLPHILHDFCKV